MRALLLSILIAAMLIVPCAAEAFPPIALSDTFVHEAPTDIDPAARYALYTAGSEEDRAAFREGFGAEMIDEFMIIYADADGGVLREYDYYVLASEEDAEKVLASEENLAMAIPFEGYGDVILRVADASDPNQYFTEISAASYVRELTEGGMAEYEDME